MKTYISILLLLILSVVSADDNKESKLVNDVFNQVYYYVKTQVKNLPEISIEYKTTTDIKAYATKDKKKKNVYEVIVSKGMLDEIIKNNKDALALVIGHEIAHITQGHLNKRQKKTTKYQNMIFSRNEEIEADTVGLKYAIGAGFSFQRAKKFIDNMIKAGYEYSSFEGTSSDHPSWYERLEYLDKEKANLWREMSAFKNGIFFLNVQQFTAAEYCFKNVINEFSGCSEAYANLGYAQLMQYCDGLTTNYLEKFNIGQLVTGAFYTRPSSLSQAVRGLNEDVWWSSVGNLREAIRLDPKLTLAYANLGIAYLVRPTGKDLKNASKYFDLSLELVGTDSSLNDVAISAIYLNYGVAFLANDKNNKAKDNFEIAKSMIAKYYLGKKRTTTNYTRAFNGAFDYNNAVILSTGTESEKEKALKLFEKYLKTTSKSLAWWAIAHKKYITLAKEVNKEPKDFNKRIYRQIYKSITTLTINNQPVFISQRKDELLNILKNDNLISQNIASGTNLYKYIDENNDIEYIVTNKLLAIFLKSERSPSITIETVEIGGIKNKLLVGMTIDEFNKAIAGEEDNYTISELIEKKKKYRYYLNLGLAVKVNKKDNIITELAIIQKPYM